MVRFEFNGRPFDPETFEETILKAAMESVAAHLHFEVVAKIYNNSGITRGDVWEELGRGQVREDSAEADLFKLLFRDLSTWGIVRQHRETDYQGNYLARTPTRGRTARHVGPKPMKSAFDDTEHYELTKLGQQFIHYAMTDLPLKLSYSPPPVE